MSKLILSENELNYARSNFDFMQSQELAKALEEKIYYRTGKRYNIKTIQRAVKNSGLVKQRRLNTFVRKTKNYDLKIEKIKHTTINGYKPVKFYPYIVLFEKTVKGITYRTCYSYTELAKITGRLENG